MTQLQTNVQERYQAALDALVAKLEQDRYVLAVILYGSLARGEAWEKSDIDLTIVQRDGLERQSREYWLVEDGINISAWVVSRGRFKRGVNRALQGSFTHSIRSEFKLLFCRDDSIAAWLAESDRVGARDQEFQLLRIAAGVPWATIRPPASPRARRSRWRRWRRVTRVSICGRICNARPTF